MAAWSKVRRVGTVAAAALVVVVGASSAGPDTRSEHRATRPVPAPSPARAGLAHDATALRLYVDPQNPAADQVRQWNADGREADARAIRKIAVQPTAVWLTGPPQDAAEAVRSVTARAEQSGGIPVFVVYDLPDRDCGNFSAGGAASADAYRRWIGEISIALANQPAMVIIEPDAVAQIVTGCIAGEAAAQRYELLHVAVDTLAAYSNVHVYLDAGNAGWVKDPRVMVQALRRAGIADARGFALNVANFFTTDESYWYGAQISNALDHRPFVIDTSRNGNGPVAQNDPVHWCNPPGRALGAVPTLDTGRPLVDAYLWVKQPGDSDGSCRAGAPAAGHWWADYALELVRGTTGTGGS